MLSASVTWPIGKGGGAATPPAGDGDNRTPRAIVARARPDLVEAGFSGTRPPARPPEGDATTEGMGADSHESLTEDLLDRRRAPAVSCVPITIGSHDRHLNNGLTNYLEIWQGAASAVWHQ